jgi:phenylalanyl-tRNA synthetase alpha chain
VTSGEGTPAAQDLISAFERLIAEFSAEIASLSSEQDMRAVQARYLGKKGKATELMKGLGRLPPSDRPAVGEAANRARAAIEQAVQARLQDLAGADLAADLERKIDVTLPGRGRRA